MDPVAPLANGVAIVVILELRPVERHVPALKSTLHVTLMAAPISMLATRGTNHRDSPEAVLRAGSSPRPDWHQLTMAVRAVGGLGGLPPPPVSASYTRSSNWRTSGNFTVPPARLPGLEAKA
jgi:hypothetical protein